MAILFAALLLFNAWFSIPYYKMDSVQLQNLDNERLSAKYRQSENGRAVILVGDLTHDKSELSSIIHELSALGYGIYVFDYQSQGQTAGTISFDVKSSEFLAEQFYCALVSFTQLSSLAEENIHIVGYGTGARAVLQTASLGIMSPKSVTLIGTELNLSGKLQYDILDFTIDSELEWVGNLNSSKPSCSVKLLYSPIDDISTASDNELIKTALTRTNEAGLMGRNSVEVERVGLCVHPLLMSSAEVTDAAVSNICALDGIEYDADFLLYLRLPAVIGMFILLGAIAVILGETAVPEMLAAEPRRFSVPYRFFRYKLLMHLLNFVVMVLLALLLYFLPITYPYTDMFRLCVVCSYGILMALLYKFSTFGDNLGRYMFIGCGFTSKRIVFTSFVTLYALVAAISVSGTTNMFAVGSRYLWEVLFTLLLLPIFFIDAKEKLLLKLPVRSKLLLSAVNFLPVFASIPIMCVMGLWSGAFKMLLAASVLLLMFCLDHFFEATRTTPSGSALIKAFFFQMLVFAQATMYF